MGLIIRPFATEHVEPAAALLAARHRRDRVWSPSLRAEYEDPAATLPLLQELLAPETMEGVVALREGRVVGYLLGAPALEAPTRTFAGVMHPRAADIQYAGHAVDPVDGAAVLPRLYAALSERWVARGLVGHYVTVPAGRDQAEIWADLGFGRFIAAGVRPTTPPDEPAARPDADIDVRRATGDDEDAVQALVEELLRSFADPPIFVPFLPETAAARSRLVADHLADPASPVWLAFANGRLVGMQMYEEPASPLWHQSPLESAPESVYLFLACTAPEARSMGVGAALFARSMAWAREAGYDACGIHFLTASRAAPFWTGLGFQTVSYWMRRFIDERATWAG